MDWKQTLCNHSRLKSNMAWLGSNVSNWKQTEPFGHKFASISNQRSCNGVKQSITDLILEVKCYRFNYSLRYQVEWVTSETLLLDMTQAGLKDCKKWQIPCHYWSDLHHLPVVTPLFMKLYVEFFAIHLGLAIVSTIYQRVWPLCLVSVPFTRNASRYSSSNEIRRNNCELGAKSGLSIA
jgi:hypothetical protein